MPHACLLLREPASPSLSSLVEKSQQRRPPHPEYDLHLTSTQLELTLTSRPQQQPQPPDEGFESDIDSVSIVSNDSSIVAINDTAKTAETDSANGSASSDSDNEVVAEAARSDANAKELFNLVDCLCYTDVKLPLVLVFVIKEEALVFKFNELSVLQGFYLNFSALKAVANQKVFNIDNAGAKFNLLQRTDNNGVTHIEITREVDAKIISPPSCEQPTSIISINTPDHKRYYKIKSSSTENILDIPQKQKLVTLSTPTNNELRKIWNSTDNIMADEPKRPERRRKLKGKAPQPPQHPPPLLKPHMPPDKDFIIKSQGSSDKKTSTSTSSSSSVNFVTLLTPKPSWTNSMPRLLKKQRSKSEMRYFTPMAYRYIDTTPTYAPMGNRLFGLSGKLRDFPLENNNNNNKRESEKWNNCDIKSDRTNLKSVIKKDDKSNKKNENKKVTFSAYTTVQVV